MNNQKLSSLIKAISIVFIGLFMLTGCSNNSESFDKKMACSEKTNGIKKELDSKKTELGNKIVGDYSLEEVFYSPAIDSCVYGYFYREELCGLNYGCTKPEDYEYKDFYVIKDALTGKEIYNQELLDLEDFRNKISELKQE